MSFAIKELKGSQTGKRFDMKVEVTPFWSDDWAFSLRVLSFEEISEKSLKEIVEQVIDRRGEWKPGKRNLTLRLNGFNANAYILNSLKKNEESDE